MPVWIGGNPPNSGERPWAGVIDEVRIYDRALSPAEIATLPPPNPDQLFTDGFESGNLVLWADKRP